MNQLLSALIKNSLGQIQYNKDSKCAKNLTCISILNIAVMPLKIIHIVNVCIYSSAHIFTLI